MNPHTLPTAAPASAPSSGSLRNHLLWLFLMAMLFWSVPAHGQIVSVATPDITPEDSALTVRYGMPELRDQLPELVYPVQAKQYLIEGRVLVDFVVGEQGRVVRSEILKSLGYGCDEEVLRVLRRARFSPVLDAVGQPQRTRYITAFDFKLGDVR